MVVVAYLYNQNGMATWCLESAHALHSGGENVLLVCSEHLKSELQKQPFPFPVFYLSEAQVLEPLASSKWRRAFNWIKAICSNASSGWVGKVHPILLKEGYSPTYYLLNQSNLQDSSVPVPQYVVAWAYPATIQGYLYKTIRQSKKRLSKEFFMALANAISWYLKDWRAYREANGVLAVSERLALQLRSKGVVASTVYPPLQLTNDVVAVEKRETDVVRILLAAVDLESEQKRIRWALYALKDVKTTRQMEFHLVGKENGLQKTVKEWGMNAIFHGFQQRQQLSAIMASCDVFVFASSFDDWGYVQVEAMAKGMIVIAPNISPSDEIVGDQKMLFASNDPSDLARSIQELVNIHLLSERKADAFERSKFFEYRAFNDSLNKLVKL